MPIIDRVKFDGIDNGNWLVCKYPSEKLSTATKLIVSEGQVAVFFKGGQIFDVFNPGTYTLTTENIPFLSAFINLPYGGETPFTAEIYFLNTTSKLDLYWGTKDPIQIVDPKYKIRLKIRAFGQFGFKISDYKVFLRELIGSMGPYKICNPENISSFFKGALITKVKNIIAAEIIKNNISALEISVHLEDLSKYAFNKVREEFNKYGIDIVSFFIESVNFPEEDFDMINKILVDKAAFDIIGEERYNTKRSFDVYEKAAENDNGAASTAASVGIGLGLANNISNISMNTSGSLGNIEGAEYENNNGCKCNSCGHINKAQSKFCTKCGEKLIEEKICENCGASNEIDAKFCSSCGNKLIKEVVCPSCKKELSEDARFCNFCGAKVGE